VQITTCELHRCTRVKSNNCAIILGILVNMGLLIGTKMCQAHCVKQVALHVKHYQTPLSLG